MDAAIIAELEGHFPDFIKAYDPKQNLQVAAYITTLVMNHLFTGKFKRTK